MNPNSAGQVLKRGLCALNKNILFVNVSTETHAHSLYLRSAKKSLLTGIF